MAMVVCALASSLSPPHAVRATANNTLAPTATNPARRGRDGFRGAMTGI
jgi:hypothetical protein